MMVRTMGGQREGTGAQGGRGHTCTQGREAVLTPATGSAGRGGDHLERGRNIKRRSLYVGKVTS